MAPPSWISWWFIRSSTMEAIKAANSASGTPVAILELDGHLLIVLRAVFAAHFVVVAR